MNDTITLTGAQAELLGPILKALDDTEAQFLRYSHIAATIRVNALHHGATEDEIEDFLQGRTSFVNWLADAVMDAATNARIAELETEIARLREANSALRAGDAYRQAPRVERPIDVDWHALGPGVYCVARDEDNDVYAYNYDPKERDGMWCYDSGEGTPCAWLLTGLALLRDPGEGDWRNSKVINPLWQGGKP